MKQGNGGSPLPIKMVCSCWFHPGKTWEGKETFEGIQLTSYWGKYTVKPVKRDHCNKRPTSYERLLEYEHSLTFLYINTCGERPPHLRPFCGSMGWLYITGLTVHVNNKRKRAVIGVGCCEDTSPGATVTMWEVMSKSFCFIPPLLSILCVVGGTYFI